MSTLRIPVLVILIAVGCSNRPVTGECSTTADCPVNPGATCARLCSDGSNPCPNVCVNHQCVMRGCPNSDGGTGTACAAAGGTCVALVPGPNVCPNGHLDGNVACGEVGLSCCLPNVDGGNGTCQPNGNACNFNSECCSGNCITRTLPGFCCIAGGCP